VGSELLVFGFDQCKKASAFRVTFVEGNNHVSKTKCISDNIGRLGDHRRTHRPTSSGGSIKIHTILIAVRILR